MAFIEPLLLCRCSVSGLAELFYKWIEENSTFVILLKVISLLPQSLTVRLLSCCVSAVCCVAEAVHGGLVNGSIKARSVMCAFFSLSAKVPERLIQVCGRLRSGRQFTYSLFNLTNSFHDERIYSIKIGEIGKRPPQTHDKPTQVIETDSAGLMIVYISFLYCLKLLQYPSWEICAVPLGSCKSKSVVFL